MSKRIAGLALVACMASVMPISAQEGPAARALQDGTFTRVLVCRGDDARVELYLPQSLVAGLRVRLARPAIGLYALDLVEARKGKTLEWVRVSVTQDGRNLVVEQYLRQLPPVLVPVDGGRVSFDSRFAYDLDCRPFNDDRGEAADGR